MLQALSLDIDAYAKLKYSLHILLHAPTVQRTKAQFHSILQNTKENEQRVFHTHRACDVQRSPSASQIQYIDVHGRCRVVCCSDAGRDECCQAVQSLSTRSSHIKMAQRREQSEHDRRPWKEFMMPLGMPADSSRAMSRLKCNLLYYRNNYAQVMAGITCLYLTRNPTGSISLAIIAAGAVLHMDKVAVAMSKKTMGMLGKVRPGMAHRIRNQPGGADGLTGISRTEEPVVKIAGIKRDGLANSLLGLGGVAALLTGAVGSMMSGIFIGTAVCAGHAVLRLPNTGARLHQFKRNLLEMGEGLTG